MHNKLLILAQLIVLKVCYKQDQTKDLLGKVNVKFCMIHLNVLGSI